MAKSVLQMMNNRQILQHGRCLRKVDGLGYIASLNMHLPSSKIVINLCVEAANMSNQIWHERVSNKNRVQKDLQETENINDDHYLWCPSRN